MGLTSDILLKAVFDHTSALDLATVSDPLTVSERIRLTSGTGAGSADMLWHDRRTLAGSATEDLDLAGVLVGAFGNTLTFARVKGLIVKASPTNTNDVQVSRTATNGVPLFLAASDGLPVRPGGLLAWVAPDAAGVVVTAGTGDKLTFTNSAGSTSVTYDVVIIGASA